MRHVGLGLDGPEPAFGQDAADLGEDEPFQVGVITTRERRSGDELVESLNSHKTRGSCFRTNNVSDFNGFNPCCGIVPTDVAGAAER